MNTNRKGAGLGRLHSQAEAIFHNSSKGIGLSRHELKKAGIKCGLIHADNTRHSYLNAWHELACFANSKHGIRNLYDLSAEIVADWLKLKLSRGLARSTLSQYVAALRILEMGLETFCRMNGFNRSFDFSIRLSIIKHSSDVHDPWRGEGRLYPRPIELINAIPDEVYRLCARLQLESGLRAEGVGNARDSRSRICLTLGNLKGVSKDPFFRNRIVGIIDQREKGGKLSRHYISVKTYRDLEKYLLEHGPIRTNYREYINAINTAARATGQYVKGRASHGLKHNFAQRFVKDGIMMGATQEKIYSEASKRCSHRRMNIVPSHYLGR